MYLECDINVTKIFNKGYSPSEKSFQCVENYVFWHSKKWSDCKLIVVHFLWVSSLHWCISISQIACLTARAEYFLYNLFFCILFASFVSLFVGGLTSLIHFLFSEVLAWLPELSSFLYDFFVFCFVKFLVSFLHLFCEWAYFTDAFSISQSACLATARLSIVFLFFCTFLYF